VFLSEVIWFSGFLFVRVLVSSCFFLLGLALEINQVRTEWVLVTLGRIEDDKYSMLFGFFSVDVP
jgi:hypothetical protein